LGWCCKKKFDDGVAILELFRGWGRNLRIVGWFVGCMPTAWEEVSICGLMQWSRVPEKPTFCTAGATKALVEPKGVV
jgi:hypothetical protein